MNAVDFVPTQRETLAGFIGDIERLEALFASWDETQRGAVDAYRLAAGRDAADGSADARGNDAYYQRER
ncbi:MAG: hypothetical protein RIF44_17960, partial [Nitratireductor sp.]